MRNTAVAFCIVGLLAAGGRFALAGDDCIVLADYADFHACRR